MSKPKPEIGILQKYVDDAMIIAHQKQERRKYLGASRWGEDCSRKLAYEYHGQKSDAPFPGRTLRIFNCGHDGEERMAEYMKVAGFEIITHSPSGGQIGFSACDEKMKGHIDGAITAGPEIPGLNYPCIWENKMLGKKSFDDVVKKGIKDSKPVYYAQVNIYMAYMELPQALFTAQNRDSCEIYHEVVDFDARCAQECSDKAFNIVNSQSPEEFPRLSNDPSDFRCKFCDFRKTCHGDKIGQTFVTDDNPITPLDPIKPKSPFLFI
jgi:hypothetical protein